MFQEDLRALEAARQQINSEFRKHAWVSNAATITELLKFGNQVEHILRTTVIQLTPKDSETYEARLTEETYMFNNVPYKE